MNYNRKKMKNSILKWLKLKKTLMIRGIYKYKKNLK